MNQFILQVNILLRMENPKLLFLIDGLGALLSAIMLGVVLVKYQTSFGMPANALYCLAAIAGMFCLYSFYIFLTKPSRWQRFLMIIAIANLQYCILTAGLVIFMYSKLTNLGVIYFVIEIIIVVLLAVFELKVASATRPK